MRGKYHIIIQNSRIKFEFDIKRNITVIRGDSATGKTTLISLLDMYERMGEESGVSISCEKKCRTINNANWESVIDSSRDCIIFADEDVKAIKSDEFAVKVKESGNYFVLVTRENLHNLPYSVEEVYGIHSSGKYMDIRQTYNSFYRLYEFGEYTTGKKASTIVVEDTNSGYDFFKEISSDETECISAGGKAGIKGILKNKTDKNILVIADGAAFGSQMAEIYLYMQSNPEISLYLPESFEWIILSSGLIDGNRIKDMVQNTENYADSADYFSWEQFYTKILVAETQGTVYRYSKQKLNEVYLNEKEKNALLKVIEVIKGLI